MGAPLLGAALNKKHETSREGGQVAGTTSGLHSSSYAVLASAATSPTLLNNRTCPNCNRQCSLDPPHLPRERTDRKASVVTDSDFKVAVFGGCRLSSRFKARAAPVGCCLLVWERTAVERRRPNECVKSRLSAACAGQCPALARLVPWAIWPSSKRRPFVIWFVLACPCKDGAVVTGLLLFHCSSSHT